ncbi:MAG: HpcH/HpaI aldolase family protein [Vicinamibacterales bacterium]
MRHASVLTALLVAALPSVLLHSQQPAPAINRMNALLADGKTVFGSFIDNKTPEGAGQVARNDLPDFVIYDTEHSPYDITQIRVFMQFMLDPAGIVRRGTAVNVPFFVRIPANGREMNQWMIKQLLDQGVHGIVAPHTETAEQAVNIVRAMRYPHLPEAPDFEPNGFRGSGPGNAVRWWGIPNAEYRARADVWPLDPRGELSSLLLVENQEGVKNVKAIARTRGVSVVFAAPGDFSASYVGDRAAVETAIQTVLAACKEASVPCGITAGPQDVEKRIKEGFRVFVGGEEMMEVGRRLAGR